MRWLPAGHRPYLVLSLGATLWPLTSVRRDLTPAPAPIPKCRQLSSELVIFKTGYRGKSAARSSEVRGVA